MQLEVREVAKEKELITKVFIREKRKIEKESLIKVIKNIIHNADDNLEEGYTPVDATIKYSSEKVIIKYKDNNKIQIINLKDIICLEYSDQVSCLIIKVKNNKDQEENKIKKITKSIDNINDEERIIYLSQIYKNEVLRILKKGLTIDINTI